MVEKSRASDRPGDQQKLRLTANEHAVTALARGDRAVITRSPPRSDNVTSHTSTRQILSLGSALQIALAAHDVKIERGKYLLLAKGRFGSRAEVATLSNRPEAELRRAEDLLLVGRFLGD